MGTKLGLIASFITICVAVFVLANTDNGRMAQGGVLLQLLATIFFVLAGLRGSRWWFAAPLFVILFWVGVAHIPALWK
jgi:hypothetical protein